MSIKCFKMRKVLSQRDVQKVPEGGSEKRKDVFAKSLIFLCSYNYKMLEIKENY